MKVETATAIAEVAKPARDWTPLNIALGPLLFALMLLIPGTSMTYAIRCGIGLLLWMSWWWLSGAVHLAVTGLLPLVVVPLFNFVPIGEILPSYSEQLVILLIGANILTTAWIRWGLDRRIAVLSLLNVGTSSIRQILVWFIVSFALASFMPRVIVAAALMPIIIAMLGVIGIENAGESRLATALLLAISWGSSIGGFVTPLGGAPNLLLMKFVEQGATHHEFLFTTWVTRLFPITVAVILAAFVFMRFGFNPEMRHVPLGRNYFHDELQKLGKMSAPEKWALGLFIAATVLAFSRDLYAKFMPNFLPAFAFLTCGLLCFFVRHGNERLLKWDYAQSKMMWGLFYLFAGGTALGEIINRTGAAKYLADLLVPYAKGGGLEAVFVFSAIPLIVGQFTSNTAAIAITGPITISTFNSLGINAVPFAYLIAATSHCGFMLPSSAGSSALAAGYGVNLKTMAIKGFWMAMLCLVVIVGVGYLLIRYWPGFGRA